jgi:hypothetical protein
MNDFFSRLQESIDLYCERTSDVFFAEPLNLFSNLAFVIAAIIPLIKLKRAKQVKEPYLEILCWMAFTVGIGSALFHSYATVWAKLSDVIPIGLFLIGYIYYLVKVLEQQSHMVAGLAVVSFMGVSALFATLVPSTLVNGSQSYLGTVVAMVVFSVTAKKVVQSRRFLYSAIAFGVALYFRTIDLSICETFPYGTHFLWHLLNGFVIWNSLDLAVVVVKEHQNVS